VAVAPTHDIFLHASWTLTSAKIGNPQQVLLVHRAAPGCIAGRYEYNSIVMIVSMSMKLDAIIPRFSSVAAGSTM
jgi:hypothetical protein